MELDSFSPVVLAIGGHDPIGGAGIQADIESVAANGCFCATALTCLTVQDSCGMESLMPLPPMQMVSQAECIIEEYPVAVIKIGLIGEAAMVDALVYLLQQQHNIPVILDPVLATGMGDNFANEKLIEAIRDKLLPLCTLVTPNSLEARRLSGIDGNLEACAYKLIDFGVKNVLITGAHERSEGVVNKLYDAVGLLNEASWERLPGEYHGSGCTLASAIAAWMARGHPLHEAVNQAQEYTWLTLAHAHDLGRCQSLPNRFFQQMTDKRR